MTELTDDSPNQLLHVLELSGNSIVGGMEKYVQSLVKNLPSRGIKVTCMAPYESLATEAMRQEGCRVFITPMADDPPWRSIQFVCELVKHERVDLIHAHLPRAHVLGGLSGHLCGIPVVATVHGMDLTAQELSISRLTETHLIMVCQQAFAQALSLGMPAERVSLIPNGVDLGTFRPLAADGALRRKFNIPQAAPLVGFVGRLSWEKGPDQFLKLAEYVHHREPKAHFILVGDGDMKDELKGMAMEMGLSRKVHFAGLSQDMSRVYPELDLLVQTSRVEGMPFALLEAMACGTPTATMNVGGIGELVIAQVTGLLSAPEDWVGLGEAVLTLIADPALRKKLGDAGRVRVTENFDLENSIDEISRLIRYLVNGAARRPHTSRSPARSATLGVQSGPMDLAEIPARKERR